MVKDYLVSVIIPCYNAEKFIGETIESVLDQTWTKIEIIVVDDQSTDNSFSIIETLSSQYPDKIRVLKQEKKGASAARNLGFQESKGDFIQYLDSDDILGKNKIKSQIEALKDCDSNTVVFGKWTHFSDSILDVNFEHRLNYKSSESGLEWLLDNWSDGQMMANSSWLASRELILKAGEWKEDLLMNQDGEFFCRVLLKSGKMIFEPEAKVFYRLPNSQNVSRQKSFGAYKSMLDSYLSYQSNLLEAENSNRTRTVLKKLFLKFIYDVYPQYPELISNAKDNISKLDVKDEVFIGGPKFQSISKLIGFYNAIKLKRFLS